MVRDAVQEMLQLQMEALGNLTREFADFRTEVRSWRQQEQRDANEYVYPVWLPCIVISVAATVAGLVCYCCAGCLLVRYLAKK